MSSKAWDLTGERFGKLTVISRNPNRVQANGHSVPNWRCRCDCGNYRDVDGSSLRHGYVKSCGCTRNLTRTMIYETQFKVPAPITVQYWLIPGRVYKFNGKRLKLLGLYHGFARFETENGFHECYSYFELEGKIR